MLQKLNIPIPTACAKFPKVFADRPVKNIKQMIYKQEVINFYNARTNYDNDITRNRAVALFDYTTLFPGQWVLDVATGTGNIAIEAAKKVRTSGSVVGIDIAKELLNVI